MSQTLAQLIQGLSVNASAPVGSLTVDSLGRVLVGASTARSNFFGTTLSAGAQVEGTGGAAGRGALSVINNDVSNNPPYVLLGRSGAASLGSNAAVVSGSRLGPLTFHGADGTSFIEAATVAGEVDGTPSANDMPGRLVFSTTSDGAASPTERFRISNDGSFSSVIPGGSTLYPQFACRAWVNFNGTGTVAIRASGNVSSITDNGVGDYTVNFTTAMADANYCAVVTGSSTDGASSNIVMDILSSTAPTASAIRVLSETGGTGTNTDSEFSNVAIFR